MGAYQDIPEVFNDNDSIPPTTSSTSTMIVGGTIRRRVYMVLSVLLGMTVLASTLFLENKQPTIQLVLDEPKTVTTSPFVMAHDAAMAYEPPKLLWCGTFKTEAFLWDDSTKKFIEGIDHSHSNNDSPFTALLDCGARALDLRLDSEYHTQFCPSHLASLATGHLYMHHGPVYICTTTFNDTLPSIIEWSENNPNEWVFLKIDTDGNTIADQRVEALLKSHKIPLLDNSDNNYCGGQLRINDTSNRRLVAYTKSSCSDDNFDDSLGYCSHKKDEYSYQPLQNYIYESQEKTKNNAALPPSEQPFFETQLIWQSKPALSCLQNTDILRLDNLSGLSDNVGEMFTNPDFRTGNYPLFETRNGAPGTYNMIKINNICNHGIEIAKSIGTIITTEQKNRCYNYCGGVNVRNNCNG